MRLRLHIDFPWTECVRSYGAPMRVYLFVGNWVIVFGAKSQAWSRKGTSNKWKRLTWRPDRQLQCRKPYTATHWNITKEWECARLRNHKGECGYDNKKER